MTGNVVVVVVVPTVVVVVVVPPGSVGVVVPPGSEVVVLVDVVVVVSAVATDEFSNGTVMRPPNVSTSTTVHDVHMDQEGFTDTIYWVRGLVLSRHERTRRRHAPWCRGSFRAK
jgi:hypothetical protein